MKRLAQLLFVLCFFGANACNNHEEIIEDAPKVEIAPESQSILSQGIVFESGTSSQRQVVKFKATAKWTAEVTEVRSSTWLSVEPTNGDAGNVIISVIAQPNTETSDREASVTIKCGTDYKTIKVKQIGVQFVSVESIELDNYELNLVEGESAKLTAIVKPGNVTDSTVTWSSSDEVVLTVVDGNVTALEEGVATITATAGGKSTNCKISVSRGPAPDGNIDFADPVAKAVCIKNWDTDGDGELSFKEAASVESLGKAFRNNHELVSFDELKYFTGVHELSISFINCIGLRSITIPKYVNLIKPGTFSWCLSLKNIEVPESRYYTSVEGVLFTKDMTELVCYPPQKEGTSYKIPESVTIIDDTAFLSCTLLESITLHDGIVSMDGSFGFCSSLKSIVIPQGVSRIGEFTFDDCYSLSEVVLHDHIERIEQQAFLNCTSLSHINLPQSITYIGESAFRGCSSIESIIIPDSVELIDEEAFRECTSLESITLSQGLKSIASSAFSGCKALIDITIPDSVLSLGRGTFRDCESLASITLSNNITELGDAVFMNCSSLISITLPEGLTSIGASAFQDCIKLETIELPESLRRVEFGAFLGCSSLKEIAFTGKLDILCDRSFAAGSGLESVCFNKGVDRIEHWAFYGASNLKRVVIYDALSIIEDQAFYGCRNLLSIELPDCVEYIGDGAFEECVQLQSFVFPKQLRVISENLFKYCQFLGSVSAIPEGITRIGANSFSNCFRLKEVILPLSISSIDSQAFMRCYELEKFIINAVNPPIVSGDIFGMNVINFIIYVPKGSIDKYKNAPFWNNYSSHIQAIQD